MVFWPRYYFVTTYACIRTQDLPHPNTSHFLVQRPQTATGPSARMRAYLSAVICVSAPPPCPAVPHDGHNSAAVRQAHPEVRADVPQRRLRLHPGLVRQRRHPRRLPAGQGIRSHLPCTTPIVPPGGRSFPPRENANVLFLPTWCQNLLPQGTPSSQPPG